MEPIESLRWIGAAILAAVLIAGIFLISKEPLGKTTSISAHIAAKRSSYIFMAILLTIGGALFYAFIAFWLKPTYHLSSLTYVILAIGFIGQLVMSWIPDSTKKTPRGKLLHDLHFIGGATVAIAMLLALLVLVANYGNYPVISGLLIVAATFYSVACVVLYAFVKRTRQHFLIYEIFYIALFALTMFALIFKV